MCISVARHDGDLEMLQLRLLNSGPRDWHSLIWLAYLRLGTCLDHDRPDPARFRHVFRQPQVLTFCWVRCALSLKQIPSRIFGKHHY